MQGQRNIRDNLDKCSNESKQRVIERIRVGFSEERDIQITESRLDDFVVIFSLKPAFYLSFLSIRFIPHCPGFQNLSYFSFLF